jgi:DNA invertase Pin-like site-specific DNA recombinase
MTPRTFRLDAIIRVSERGGREGEDFRSPEQQRDICKGCAQANDGEIVAWHDAIDVSGKTMRRDDVDAALERIRSGQTDGIVVAWLDRFSRAPVAEALQVYDDIAAAGGRVIAADMAGLDPRDSTGEFALTLMLATNRMQWRRLADRWEMNRRDAVLAGKHIGPCPFGYQFIDPTPRGRGVVDSHLVPHPVYGPIVAELYERKAAGATWLELARWLDEVAPKPGRRKWARSSVTATIGSRVYLGAIHHGGLVKPGAHDPLVTAAVWRKAQNKPGRRTPRGHYMLSGLVRCAGCGRCMRASSGGATTKPRVYQCVTPECELRYTTVTVERIDEEVTVQFFARLGAFHLRPVDSSEIDAARTTVAERTGEVERLAAVVPTHPAAVEAHQAALVDAEQVLIDAEDRLAQLVASSSPAQDVDELRAAWPGLTIPERREILRASIDAILVRRASSRTWNLPVADRIRVCFRGEAPDELLGDRDAIGGWAWDDDSRTPVAAA